jgi:hypothetical protein
MNAFRNWRAALQPELIVDDDVATEMRMCGDGHAI